MTEQFWKNLLGGPPLLLLFALAGWLLSLCVPAIAVALGWAVGFAGVAIWF